MGESENLTRGVTSSCYLGSVTVPVTTVTTSIIAVQGAVLRLKLLQKALSTHAKNVYDPPLDREFNSLFNRGSHAFFA